MKGKTGVKNRRFLFTKNSIMMLVMLVVIFLAIFAWYRMNKSVTATGVTISARDTDRLEIAEEVTVNGNKTIGSWGGTININDGFAFSNDVTSNGLDFIIPGFNTNENNSSAKAQARMNGKIVNEDGIPSNAVSNLEITSQQIEAGKTPDYYAYEFYVRSTNPQIVVNPTAYLAMAAEKGVADTESHTDITGADSARKSIYGDFTSDALVAAMRVSIDTTPVTAIDNDNVPTANSGYSSNFVWNPRPDLFLSIPEGESESNWSLTTGVTKSTSLSRNGQSLGLGSTYKHNYYAKRYDTSTDNINGVTYVADPSADNEYTETLAGVQVTKKSNAYKSDTSKLSTDTSITNGSFGDEHSVPTLGVTVPLIPNLDSQSQPITYTPINGYYVFKFRLNLWIEGTDTEARRAMDTGKFNLYLEFGTKSHPDDEDYTEYVLPGYNENELDD